EALLARRAVVASDVGSTAEAVRDGETGLLVPPENPAALAAAIRRLLAEAELRQRLGEQGRRLGLNRFTADHMTRRFESLYAELLRGAGRRTASSGGEEPASSAAIWSNCSSAPVTRCSWSTTFLAAVAPGLTRGGGGAGWRVARARGWGGVS